MKNKIWPYLILTLIILFLFTFIFLSKGFETVSGYVVMKANEGNPFAFYAVLGSIILIAAVLSYIYGVKKYGLA